MQQFGIVNFFRCFDGNAACGRCFSPTKSVDEYLASTGEGHHVSFTQHGIGSCLLNHTVATQAQHKNSCVWDQRLNLDGSKTTDHTSGLHLESAHFPAVPRRTGPAECFGTAL